MSDSDLIGGAREGDDQARDRLIGKQRSRLRRLADRMVGSNLARRCERSDIVQETMLQATRSFGGFRGSSGSFFFWLWGIMRNVVRGAARSDARHVVTTLLAEEPPANMPTASDQAGMDEETILLHRCLAKLYVDERQVIRLRIYDEKTFPEVAQELGLDSADAARMRYNRAVDKLKQLMICD